MDRALPTKKQQALLEFIDEFIREQGFAPSYREVMRALDYKSVSTVASHIDGLIARGWLIKRENSKRSVEVVFKTKNGEDATEAKGLTSSFLTHANWVCRAFEAILERYDTTRDLSYLLDAEKLRDVMDILGVAELRSSAEKAIAERRNALPNVT